MVNGERGETFTMERTIHQGWPLAPYLCLFIVDVMGYMVSNPTYKLEGSIFPNGKQVWDQCL